MHYRVHRCACPCAAALIRVEGDIVTLRMCAGSKSFCAIENFASASARTCGVHLSWPSAADSAKGGGRKRSRTAAAPVKAAPGAQVALSPLHPAPSPPPPLPAQHPLLNLHSGSGRSRHGLTRLFTALHWGRWTAWGAGTPVRHGHL